MVKLNIGSNSKKVKGFKNLDIQALRKVDIVWDCIKTPYPFDSGDVEEIISEEFLEHISFRDTIPVLMEWHRILKPKGKLYIQVPAIDKMCEMFANKEVCPDNNCIPHKPNGIVKANPNCQFCNGKGKVNLNRWKFAFSGAQKHLWDAHLNHFTKSELRENLYRAGFQNVRISYDEYEWKLKANCQK